MNLKDSNSGLLAWRKCALIHGVIFPAPLNINTCNLEGFGVIFSITNKAISVQYWLDCWGIFRYHKNFPLQKFGMDINKPNPLHIPRGQVSPCRGEMLRLAPPWNGPSSPPTSQYGPGNCEVKDVSFSPLVFLFHHSAGHCPSPAAGLLYSGSYRAPYHLAFCRQVPCFPLGTSPSAIDFSKSG